jgi:hypothetical protein
MQNQQNQLLPRLIQAGEELIRYGGRNSPSRCDAHGRRGGNGRNILRPYKDTATSTRGQA